MEASPGKPSRLGPWSGTDPWGQQYKTLYTVESILALVARCFDEFGLEIERIN